MRRGALTGLRPSGCWLKSRRIGGLVVVPSIRAGAGLVLSSQKPTSLYRAANVFHRPASGQARTTRNHGAGRERLSLAVHVNTHDEQDKASSSVFWTSREQIVPPFDWVPRGPAGILRRSPLGLLRRSHDERACRLVVYCSNQKRTSRFLYRTRLSPTFRKGGPPPLVTNFSSQCVDMHSPAATVRRSSHASSGAAQNSERSAARSGCGGFAER
jgi:hypothetical protein